MPGTMLGTFPCLDLFAETESPVEWGLLCPFYRQDPRGQAGRRCRQAELETLAPGPLSGKRLRTRDQVCGASTQTGLES